jgi:hypothetical protein
VSLRRARTAPADTPTTAAACDACRTEIAGLVPHTIDGVQLMLCPHPTPCRQRAQAKGEWMP